MHVIVLAGTRPEVVKMAPVIHALRKRNGINVTVCSSGQHKEMLAQAFADFQIEPDLDLDVMTKAQELAALTGRLFVRFDALFEEKHPDWLLVQGDTTSVMVAAVCAFYRDIKVGHVEAGLRSHNNRSPFPEEINRKVVSLVAHAHFVPTQLAKENLLKEGIADNAILITGNTVVDALRHMLDRAGQKNTEACPRLSEAFGLGKRIILVTAHRRENLGVGIAGIIEAIRRIAKSRDDALFIYPVHLNPAVNRPVHEGLRTCPNVILLDPLPYPLLLETMSRCEFILTDSGGFRRRVAKLRKPVLILRDTTERREGVDAGAARLVGTDADFLEAQIMDLLNHPQKRQKMPLPRESYMEMAKQPIA